MTEFKETKLPKLEIEQPKETDKPNYPNLYLPLELVPGAEKWSMDKDHEITLRVKISNITTRRSKGEDKDKGSIDFAITGIKIGKGDLEKEKESEGSYKERS